VNPQCLDSIDLQVQRIGGTEGALMISGFFCVISFSLWIVIIARSKCIRESLVDNYSKVYDNLLSDNDEEVTGVIGPTTMHMRDSDIWGHTYRMYLIGENSISYPWYLPKDFPEDALTTNNKEKLLRFIKRE